MLFWKTVVYEQGSVHELQIGGSCVVYSDLPGASEWWSKSTIWGTNDSGQPKTIEILYFVPRRARWLYVWIMAILIHVALRSKIMTSIMRLPWQRKMDLVFAHIEHMRRNGQVVSEVEYAPAFSESDLISEERLGDEGWEFFKWDEDSDSAEYRRGQKISPIIVKNNCGDWIFSTGMFSQKIVFMHEIKGLEYWVAGGRANDWPKNERSAR